jgi:flagellar FliL protein
MSEEGAKPADGAPKKSKTGMIIGIVIALVTLVGGSVAGAVLGPRLLGGGGEESHATPKAPEGGHGEKKSSGGHGAPGEGAEKIVSVDIPPLVVDLTDSEGRLRHLKCGLAAELADGVAIEDFKLVIPRAREAILSYLRSLTFEEVGDPARYMGIKEELSKRVTEAVGAERVHRILLIDFVLQ